MKWIVDYWALLVIIITVVAGGISTVRKAMKLDREQQIAQAKVCLLKWVSDAERELGGGVGQLKLRTCYELFISKFPQLAAIISFETFAEWVDDALDVMRDWLKSNSKFKDYIEGKEDGESN